MEDSDLAAEEARAALYEVFREETPFDEMVGSVLDLGVRYLDVENGHLTRVDLETDHWKIVGSTDGEGEMFHPGMERSLSTTYCRRAMESDSSLALHDAPDQGWSDDPAFESTGVHCYIGTRLVVDDTVYGTLCFVDQDPREGFSTAERTWAELAARLLERELENQQHEDRLTRQANLALVFNRVLRHNVRNSVAVIRGYTQMMVDRLEEGSEGEVALKHIDSLLRLTEKARSLDEVVSSEFDRSEVDVVALVERVAESVAERYPSASISVEHPEESTATLYPSFERAVTELVENAAKHAGASPEVEVSVELEPNELRLVVEDDGPGLSQQELKVLEKGTETPLIHSSGLGLWIAHYVVESHLGSLEVESSDEGTRLTISIPRGTAVDKQAGSVRMLRSPGVYQAAFEEASDGMVVIDDEARILEANRAAESIYGLGREELLGRTVKEFMPEDFDFEAAWREFQSDGQRRDTVTVVGGDDVERDVVYSATTDIVPGQHLVVARES